MVGVVGCISKKKPEEIKHTIATMSSRLYHRGEHIHTRIVKLNPLEVAGFHIALRTISHNPEEPFIEKNGNIGLIDTISQLSRTGDLTEGILEKQLHATDPLSFETMSKQLYLANLYAVTKSGFSFIRSIDGQRMLYMTKSDDDVYFSSERKCLWAIGLKETDPYSPGLTTILKNNGTLVKYEYEREFGINRETITKPQEILDLKKMLVNSFSVLEGITKCGVLFSGGVDSSLVAHLVSKVADETILFTTNTSSSHDRTVARDSADILGLDLVEVSFIPDIIWNVLPEVIYAIETTNRMDVEIALPFFLAASEAKKKGINLLVSGQGPDEIFAGYAKHVRLVEEFGFEVLNDQLKQEIAVTHEANIARDEKAIAHCGVAGFFPYLENRFVTRGLAIPAEWKIDPGKLPERKLIFCELARALGLPEKIAYRPKSATQYSSGSSKMLASTIQLYVSELKNKSKKQVVQCIQKVLDIIGSKVGVVAERKLEEIQGIDFQAVETFVRNRDTIHQQLLEVQ